MKLIKIWSLMLFSVVALVIFSCSSDPTCTDGEQNGGEVGIDCGGPCISCDSIGLVIPIDTSTTPMFSCDTLLCAKVNGEDFVGEVTTAEEITSIILKGVKGGEQITIYYNDLREVGTYDFSMTTGDYINGIVLYETSAPEDGSITISAIDTTAKTISGTFNYTASSAVGTIQITDGAFSQLTYD